MKSRKIILLIAFILGIIGLWMMVSLAPPNACEYASTNLEYIKSKIQEAVKAKELKMVRYNAYKALNGIEKTRINFEDCGCTATMDCMEQVLSQLKMATKSISLEETKNILGQAMENTIVGMEELRAFNGEHSSPYGADLLYLNTKEMPDGQNWLIRIPDGKLKELVEDSLMEFENSLAKVIAEVDCTEARRFISKIYEDSRTILLNTELSDYKKQYHNRVKTLTLAALHDLGGCTG